MSLHPLSFSGLIFVLDSPIGFVRVTNYNNQSIELAKLNASNFKMFINTTICSSLEFINKQL